MEDFDDVIEALSKLQESIWQHYYGGGRKMARVLIIDDDVDLARSMADLLIQRGHEVEIAHNGDQGMMLLSECTDDKLPELILLDWDMPVSNGFMFRANQMQVPKYASIPTILCSGQSLFEQKKAFAGMGLFFLPKPIDFDKLYYLLSCI